MTTMTRQARFTGGIETRKQPKKRQGNFEFLLQVEDEQRKRLERLNAKLAPAVVSVAELIHHPEQFAKDPRILMDLRNMQMVSPLSSYGIYQVHHGIFQDQRTIGNWFYSYTRNSLDLPVACSRFALSIVLCRVRTSG